MNDGEINMQQNMDGETTMMMGNEDDGEYTMVKTNDGEMLQDGETMLDMIDGE